MKILAIDTTFSACSAALLLDNEVIERCEWCPRGHTRLLLPMLQSLFADAGITLTDLSAIAFSCGPGSFTGIRIASGVVQGLAFAKDLPVIPISTLHALAQTAYREMHAERVLVATDARMNEVYWGAYSVETNGLMKVVIPEDVISPDKLVFASEQSWWGIGDGWAAYEAILQMRFAPLLQSINTECYPKAQDIARLAVPNYLQGNVLSAEQALPIYLRELQYGQKTA